jgi:hypothetical protein
VDRQRVAEGDVASEVLGREDDRASSFERANLERTVECARDDAPALTVAQEVICCRAKAPVVAQRDDFVADPRTADPWS